MQKLLALLLLLCGTVQLHAQRALLYTPSECVEYNWESTDCSATGSCPALDNLGSCHWTRSHGSPRFVAHVPDPPTAKYGSLWAGPITGSIEYGEGFFTSATFAAGVGYTVTITCRTNGSGNLRLYAANGLTEGALIDIGSDCGGTPPSVSTQEIGRITETSGTSFITRSFNFVPAFSGYTQLWIYGVGTGSSTPSDPYRADVWTVTICPGCSGNPIFNKYALPTKVLAQTITIGSSAGTGGVGTVYVDGTANTVLLANETVIKHEFHAQVSTGSLLISADDTCSSSGGSALRLVDDIPGGPLTEPEPRRGAITSAEVWPSRGTGIFQVRSRDRTLQGTSLSVVDINGREVWRKDNLPAVVNMEFNIGSSPPGIYFVRVISRNNVVTKKVILVK